MAFAFPPLEDLGKRYDPIFFFSPYEYQSPRCRDLSIFLASLFLSQARFVPAPVPTKNDLNIVSCDLIRERIRLLLLPDFPSCRRLFLRESIGLEYTRGFRTLSCVPRLFSVASIFLALPDSWTDYVPVIEIRLVPYKLMALFLDQKLSDVFPLLRPVFFDGLMDGFLTRILCLDF